VTQGSDAGGGGGSAKDTPDMISGYGGKDEEVIF
jgi:hypothetical protein